MKKLIILILAVCCAITVSVVEFTAAKTGIIFADSFDNGLTPYDGYLFGYSNDPIKTEIIADGGLNGGNSLRIPLGGTGRTNFSTYVGKDLANLRKYHLRWRMKVSPDFASGGENFKLTYNYTYTGGERSAFVLWYRTAYWTGESNAGTDWQPMFWTPKGDNGRTRTEDVPTFFLSQFKGQWVTFEQMCDMDTNTVKLWISTEDGRYNDTLYIDSVNSPDAPFSVAGDYYNHVSIGAYYDGQGNNSFFEIDDIVISDAFIGQ